MRKAIKKYNILTRILILMVFGLFIGLTIISCNKSPNISGTKWTSGPIGEDIKFKEGVTIEFFSDHTFSQRLFFQTMIGKWTILDDGSIKMEHANPINPYFTIANIEGEQLKITDQFGSSYFLNRFKPIPLPDMAKMQIKSLEIALKLYKLDNGIYPSTQQGLKALVQAPTIGKIPPKWRQGGYLEKNKVPKDPWGNDYIYISPGAHSDFDLISLGADGEFGGKGDDKDINNWEN
jgi:type II secretion system protein G